VAHLAIRAALTNTPEELKKVQSDIDPKTLKPAKTSKEVYSQMLSLVEHSSVAETDDIFQYALTAALLTSFLEQRTTYFGKEPEEHFVTFVGSLLLKHILQLVCNAR